jgi:sigma-B regulation protein RsbU (phosphoserine phosphatase)
MAADPSSRHRLAPAPVQLNPFRTLPGRLLLLSAGVLALLWVIQQFITLPAPIEALRKVVSLTTRLSILWLAGLLAVRHRHRFLWRVRRKLILSYVFLGFVPVVLIALFVLAGGFILHANIAGYLFREGLDDIIENMALVATTTATEIGGTLTVSGAVLDRKFSILAEQYPGLSLAVVPVETVQRPVAGVEPTRQSAAPVATAGAWRHMDAPADAPLWSAARAFSGLLTMVPKGVSAADSDEERLLIRASVPLPGRQQVVLVDLPVDTDMLARLDEQTSVRVRSVAVNPQVDGAQPETARPPPVPERRLVAGDEALSDDGVGLGFFRRTVLQVDFTEWRTGRTGLVAIALDAPLAQVYARIEAAQAGDFSQFLFVALGSIAVLLLSVQGVALFFGVGLGRQITSAVHELFVGTERVQQGDFTHRIKMESKDQLGALGESFNRMSTSIEHLLHVQREKQRLDDELRIAREIQTSLLPDRPPAVDGLTIADLCVPAREVGGDYYDFFELGPRQLGVLVADVSGKGTSAALYMAELKGLMLALSHEERSPKKLLVRVNHLLADHLDNRSFITMTYGVIDLDARTLTHARAGHTPLIVVSDRCPDEVEVIVPNGMVLGLRLPGASDRFESLLEEHTMPLTPGDVIVFYTDGITEAMNVGGDLFSDEALAHVVCSHRRLDASGIRERVLRDVHAFVGEAEPHDDMTMVIVKVSE